MTKRIVQWGTGNVGIDSLIHLIQHPHYELVGLHAHSPEKIGKDAAEIAGLQKNTGIIATNDVAALLALKPDCVTYNANGELRPHEAVKDLVSILSAGINVVSTALIFLIYPPFGDPKLRAPLEEACRKGNSTLFINGIDPGFSGDVLPLAALQLTDQVETIHVQELLDYSTYEDPEFTGMTFGFGQAEDFTPIMAVPGILKNAWGSMIAMIAAKLDIELDEMRESYERCYANESFETPMMNVEKGTCSAMRFRLEGIAYGRPVIITEHVNYLRKQDLQEDWPTPPDGRQGVHRAIITGNPNVQIEAFLEGKDGDYNTGGVKATVMRMINAIPDICAHKAGMISTIDLGYSPTTHILKTL